MTIHKIRSGVLRKQGVKVEGLDRSRIEARLREVRKTDPKAKIISVPSER